MSDHHNAEASPNEQAFNASLANLLTYRATVARGRYLLLAAAVGGYLEDNPHLRRAVRERRLAWAELHRAATAARRHSVTGEVL